MAAAAPDNRASVWPGMAVVAMATVYVIAFLASERQLVIVGLLVLGMFAVFAVSRGPLSGAIGRSFAEHERVLGLLTLLALVAVAGYFYDNHFVLLLVVT